MNILITGASKGIGKAIAQAFCRRGGCKLFLVSRDKSLLEDLQAQTKLSNPNCETALFPCDISEPVLVTELAKSIMQKESKIDILINNAGALVNKKHEDISEDEIDLMFNTNFKAPANLIRELLPLLRNADHAHVVNIGSMGGVQGSSKYPGLAYYSASKAALSVLTECLAEEYKNQGISFNCLALGAIQTEMFAQAFPEAKAPVTAYDMAEFIMNFSLTAHKFMNGKIIPLSLSDPK